MKAVRYLVAPLAVGMALATGSASVAVPAARVALTNADNGRSVPAALGDDIEVRLTSYRESGLTYTWSTPQSGNTTVLRRTTGGTKPDGGASAVFRAQHGGTATISAARRCHADAGHVCPLVIAPWRARIRVE
ncbi:hypothetical protein [Streptomyces hiroshimensis]|uniref:Uncharacterized protein n=1 Tax=Streptomyces hiroshimensis TaxID=66424 RepID=A0ABQ2Y8Q6_9ACTN|nr:hypothetical protein [Streptomyces hiroshimensis]GGX73783.1 hypothetical protein GCM10010324_18850 [Streptomyces hiroshimensis]